MKIICANLHVGACVCMCVCEHTCTYVRIYVWVCMSMYKV